MKKDDLQLLLYTENHVKGGGSKYFTDLILAAKTFADKINVVTNKAALTESEKEVLSNNDGFKEIGILSRASVLQFLGRKKQNKILSRLLFLFEPFFIVYNFLQFLGNIKKYNPTVIISCNGGYPAATSALLLTVCGRMFHKPSILVVLSSPQKRRSFLYYFDLLIDKVVNWSISRVIVNSFTQAKLLNRDRGFPENKIHCLYNSIVDTKLPFRANSTHKIITIGYTGRLDPLKGVNVLLNAIADIPDNSNIQFHIYGEGPFKQKLLGQVNELNLNHHVSFLGYFDQPVEYVLATFDIYVMPSLWEGLPYSIIEAMRSGLPIIASNVGGIPEAVIHNYNGFLVELGDYKSISKYIEQLAGDETLRKRMGDNSRKLFLEKFERTEFNNRVKTIVNSL